MGLENVVHTKNFDSNMNSSRIIVGVLPPPNKNLISIEQIRVALITKESDLGF